MMQVTVYDPVSGSFGQTCSEEHARDVLGAPYYEGVWHPGVWYMKDGAPAFRPDGEWTIDKTSVKADEIDEVRITGPAGAVARYTVAGNGVYLVGQTDEGQVVLKFDTPGVYSVELEAFPALPQRWEVTAL